MPSYLKTQLDPSVNNSLLHILPQSCQAALTVPEPTLSTKMLKKSKLSKHFNKSRKNLLK